MYLMHKNTQSFKKLNTYKNILIMLDTLEGH